MAALSPAGDRSGLISRTARHLDRLAILEAVPAAGYHIALIGEGVTNQQAVNPAVLEKSLVHHFGTSVGPTVVDAVGAVFSHERLEADRKGVGEGTSW